MNDHRLGRITEAGVTRPAVTLSGKPYAEAHTVRGLPDGYFVVLDDFPAPSFDTEAEIAKLTAQLAPPKTAAARAKDE